MRVWIQDISNNNLNLFKEIHIQILIVILNKIQIYNLIIKKDNREDFQIKVNLRE